ncbi:propionyl-CoA carboxylase regulator [Amylibacter ulvae]|uniref:Propionyl-CoA carboxylase regulator n=1 Tax=Paramylibacter ulvae TaxID=1651968 RepID=A0ABQ3D405_9RHOB|nr:helix-turn-helix transcriptional regulator [Amylibacter ulvae]GHA54651.1 propionyl-CoA carboxylase regulator [Amylibacter ulvae]
MSNKLYAGVALRETRQKFDLTQKEFAQRLGVSLPYLNQMENNHRPIASSVILALAQNFGFDVTQLRQGGAERSLADMKEALADPVFAELSPPMADLQLMATNAPTLTRAFLELHRNYKQTQERLASLDEALGRQETGIVQSPWEEVRDFFHYCDNYIDAVDKAAESYAAKADILDGDGRKAAADWLMARHGVSVSYDHDTQLRRFDPDQNILFLNQHVGAETQLFQIIHQTALIEHDDLLEMTLDTARFQSDAARAICKIGLANYFAGAAVMPYAKFLQAAQEHRHDLEHLGHLFGASVEQVAHRLSTLQRPGLKGIPFFFVRVDQAGTITKRHSSTRMQFARFGGACPLWNVHRAFETPGQFLRQLAETPDGVRYLCLAREVSKPGGSFHAPTRRYAIGLGCEVKHAASLVYADDLAPRKDSAFEPIGISCRICERENCHQRSVPPLERKLDIDMQARGVVPYRLG